MDVLIAILVIVGIIVFLTWVYIDDRKAKKQKAKETGIEDALKALHFEGLGLPRNMQCDIYRFQDKIVIDAKNQAFEIPIDKIKAVAVHTERELIEKGKSVVGRAIIGTLIVPGLGTIVGGLSGIGTKKKRGRTHYFLILNYLDKNGQMAAITFLNGLTPSNKMLYFANSLKSVIDARPKEVVQL